MKKLLLILLLLPFAASAQRQLRGSWQFPDTVKVVTQSVSDSSTKAASTAFVKEWWVELTVSSYTPTLTNTTNISASTAHTTYYRQVGDWVYVWGEVEIDATAATTISELRMNVPVATSLSNSLFGTGAAEDNTSVRIFDDAGGTVKLRFTPQTATNNKYSFHYSYKWVAP